MFWPNLTEAQAQVLKGSLKGAVRGAAVGGTASIASGAAVIFAAPAWLPWIGGTLVITGTTLALWTTVGCVSGALTGGAWAYARQKHRDREFRRTFGE